MKKLITMSVLLAHVAIVSGVTADKTIAQTSAPASTQQMQQNGGDSSFAKRVTAISWMPDGKALLLNVMKIDKSGKVSPVPKKFMFDLTHRQFNPLPLDGSGLAAAPNGKSIAYLKRVDNTDQIYLYDLRTKTERPHVSDTHRKFAISWSHDGKFLAYNIGLGTGRDAAVEVCVYSFATNRTKQITHRAPYRSYNPVWNPKNNTIVYYLEKGDGRDQVYLTDSEGSFSKNLTNDATSNNYYPSWLNENTILYVNDPDNIMTMLLDGSNRQKVEGISSKQAKYNPRSMKIAYIDKADRLMLYDWKNKTIELLLDEARLSLAPFD